MTPNRRIFLNIVATYGRSLYAFIIGLFCGRWTLMALGEVDYGLMGVVGGLTAFISFLNGVMAGGVGRFYAISVGAAKNDPVNGLEKCREWFTTAVMIHTTLPVVLMAIGYPIGEWAVRHFLTIPPDRVEACVWVWRFTCLNCFVGMASVPYHAMYGAHQEIAELTIYSFAKTTFNVIFLYYVINHPGDWLVRFAIWGSFISISPSLIISLRAFIKYRECRFEKKYINCLARIKEMISYCGWLVLGAMSLLLKRQGVVLLVNKFFGPKVNAAMAVGNTLSNHCTQLSGSLEGAFWPAIVSAYGEGDHARFYSLIFRVSKFATCLILLFAVPLALEVEEVLALWLKKPPMYTGGLCICFLIVLVTDKLTTGHCTAINAVGRVAIYQSVISSVLFLTVPIGWILLQLGYNVYAVSCTMIGTTIAATLVRVVFAQRIVGLSIAVWVRHTVIPLFVAALFSSLLSCIPRYLLPPSFGRVFITAMFFLMSYLPLVFFVVMDGEERSFIIHHLKRRSLLKV